MKTEEIMATIKLYVAEGATDEEKELFNEGILGNFETGKNKYGITRLSDIYIEMKEQLRQEVNKANGNVTRDKIVKRLSKTIEKDHPYFANKDKFISHADMFCFIDGVRAYLIKGNLGYEECDNNKNPFNEDILTRIFKTSDGIILDVDIEDLKMFVKTYKAEKKDKTVKVLSSYIIEKDSKKYAYNPEFLLDLLQMFDTNYIMVNGKYSPAYINKDGEKGVLMPVILKED